MRRRTRYEDNDEEEELGIEKKSTFFNGGLMTKISVIDSCISMTYVFSFYLSFYIKILILLLNNDLLIFAYI